jgi:phage I-like protein
MTRIDEAEVMHEAIEALVLEAGDAPARILIAPWGEVRSSLGTFVVDRESAAATIAAFEAHGTDLPVDWEHQSLGGTYSSPTGQAPAAGWIKSLRAVSPEEAAGDPARPTPGLWAEVEWTPSAAEQLRAKHYRYLSPVALVRRGDRRLIGLHSAALTNKPAIVGMPAMVNRAAGAVPALTVTGTAEVLRAALGLDAAMPDEAVIGCAAERIATLEAQAAARAAEDRVARACSAGKLTESQRDWALALARQSPAAFDAWEASAPQVVPLGRTTAPAATGLPGRSAVESAARAEWRENRGLLEGLCSEEAYVAEAVRFAGIV